MTIQTLPDITASGALAPAGSTLQARRIWLCAHATSNARYGDVNVGAGRGVELPADQLVTISASDADISDKLPLAQQFVYVPNGTTVSVSFAI
jgi:hypothetical protein